MKTKRPKKPCVIEGCDRLQSAKGLCAAHYNRQCNGRSLAGPIPPNRSGANNSKWRGGVISDGHGRILVYAPNHPCPNWGGTHVYRYRLVMEEKLGRFLLPSELVHHKNEIQNDDSPDNLEITTRSGHVKIHHPKMMCARKEKAGY